MTKSKSALFWGIIIVAIGLIFLGNTLDIIDVEIFFDGWWTLFIIIPSFYGLIRGNGIISSLFGVATGAILLCASQEVIRWNMVGKLFIPLILISIGLSLLFKPKFKRIEHHHSHNDKEYVGVFSGNSEKVIGDFNGTDCVAVFGGVDLDLTDANIKDGTVIECVAIFGGVDIIVPKNVIVKTSGVPIFGGMENNVDTKEDKKKITLNVNYVCVFGAVEIK